MAKVIGPLFANAASGRYTPGFTFRCFKYWTQFSSYVAQKQSRASARAGAMGASNPKFIEQQERFKTAAAFIKTLNPTEMELWKEFTKKIHSRDGCTMTESEIAATAVIISYAMVSIGLGVAIARIPALIQAPTTIEWLAIQAAKKVDKGFWQVILETAFGF